VFKHSGLERFADFHAVKAERANAAHGIAELRRLDLERHEPPVEAGPLERLLDEILRRIAGRRVGDQTALFDERFARHRSYSESRDGRSRKRRGR